MQALITGGAGFTPPQSFSFQNSTKQLATEHLYWRERIQ